MSKVWSLLLPLRIVTAKQQRAGKRKRNGMCLAKAKNHRTAWLNTKFNNATAMHSSRYTF